MDGLRCDGCGAFAEHATLANLEYRRVTQSPVLSPVPQVEHYCRRCWQTMQEALTDRGQPQILARVDARLGDLPDLESAATHRLPGLAEWVRARLAGR
jgi:hypothetical protein